MGRIGSGVRVSASFKKNANLMGWFWSGPCLVADKADVVLADRVNRADVVFNHALHSIITKNKVLQSRS